MKVLNTMMTVRKYEPEARRLIDAKFRHFAAGRFSIRCPTSAYGFGQVRLHFLLWACTSAPLCFPPRRALIITTMQRIRPPGEDNISSMANCVVTADAFILLDRS